MPWWLRRFMDFLNWLATRVSSRKYAVLARRIGRSEPQLPDDTTPRRFIAIQIDGLAHEHLIRAMALGYTPTLQRLVGQGYRLQRWRCGLPTSTPSVQSGIMYGNNWDVPAFRWYEKAERYSPMCKVPAHVERLKARIKGDRRGILEGGSSYANMLDGDARLALFTLSAMGRQRFFEQLRGFGWALLFLLSPISTLRTVALTIWELLRAWARATAQWVRSGLRQRLTLVKPILQVVVNIIFGEIETFGILLDIYRGMPAIYANYYGFDELAHSEGPLSKEALRALKRIDGHLRKIDHVRRTYWPETELLVFSDHGMTPTVLFQRRTGVPLGPFVQRYVKGGVVWEEGVAEDPGSDREVGFLLDELDGIKAHLPRRGQRLIEAIRRFIADRTTHDTESGWNLKLGQDVVVRSSGSLAHIYFNVTPERMEISEVAILYPELVEALAHNPAIGLVLGLEAGREVSVTPRGIVALEEAGLAPGLSEPQQSTTDIRRLLRFPHCGDLVLFGAWDRQNRVVTFEDQVATHGGIGGPQEYPFFITPPDVPLELSCVTNAEQLYPFFMQRYHEAATE